MLYNKRDKKREYLLITEHYLFFYTSSCLYLNFLGRHLNLYFTNSSEKKNLFCAAMRPSLIQNWVQLDYLESFDNLKLTKHEVRSTSKHIACPNVFEILHHAPF